MMNLMLAKMIPAEARAEILLSLDRFLRQTINDEEIFMTWLEEGVPDGTVEASELEDVEAEEFVEMWQLAERLLNEEMEVEATTHKGPCEARGCGYFYKDEDDERPRCHWEDDGFPAPCEEDDEPADIDDDAGYNPYMGCMDWDC